MKPTVTQLRNNLHHRESHELRLMVLCEDWPYQMCSVLLTADNISTYRDVPQKVSSALEGQSRRVVFEMNQGTISVGDRGRVCMPDPCLVHQYTG